MRLAYQPIPHLHLNWAEMNLAWTFTTTALCCLRNLYNLPLTVPVAADTSGKTMWTVSLRPLRNRTLIRMLLLQRHDHPTTAIAENEDSKPTSTPDYMTSGPGNARNNNTNPYTILQDITLNLAGQLQPEQSAPRQNTKNQQDIHINSDKDTSSFRHAIHALIAYILVTAKDVDKSIDVEMLLPVSWQQLDWYRCLTEDCNNNDNKSSSSSSTSQIQGSRDPDSSGLSFPIISGEELARFTGNALTLLLATAEHTTG